MPHLRAPHIGWENERLASYLLSRFSFVAQPVSVGDDVGSDFFCTLFEIAQLASGHDALRPLSSFAIQVKSSSTKSISMNGKRDYLRNLEVPFFIGVVHQSPPSMIVYSAEFLPYVLELFGSGEKLSLRLVDKSRVDATRPYNDLRSKKRGVELLCPAVATLSARDDRVTLEPTVEKLHRICVRANHNIAARVSNEHIYDMDGKQFQILAGPGSALHFRMNFLKRLGEVFYNLKWSLQGDPTERWLAEFRVFDSLYRSLKKLDEYRPTPPYVSFPYDILKNGVAKYSTTHDTEEPT